MYAETQQSKAMGNMAVYIALAGLGAWCLLTLTYDPLGLWGGLAALVPTEGPTCRANAIPQSLMVAGSGILLVLACLLPATLWSRRKMGLPKARRLLTILPLVFATTAVLSATFAYFGPALMSDAPCVAPTTKSGALPVPAAAMSSAPFVFWTRASTQIAIVALIAIAPLMALYPARWKGYG